MNLPSRHSNVAKSMIFRRVLVDAVRVGEMFWVVELISAPDKLGHGLIADVHTSHLSLTLESNVAS